MFKRGPALLHPFRETCLTFPRGRGVLLRCYSATTPQALLTDTSPTGSSGLATLLVFITSHPTTHGAVRSPASLERDEAQEGGQDTGRVKLI